MSVDKEAIRNRCLQLFDIQALRGFHIDEQGRVSVVGDLEIYKEHQITKFGVKFYQIEGSFYCDNVGLETLEGSPDIIGGTFDCSRNVNLKTLDGAPREVHGPFRANNCGLVSLMGGPERTGDYIVYDNHMDDLKGAPATTGDFHAHRCGLTSLEGAPRKVFGEFKINGNKITSLVGAPESVVSIVCSGNTRLISLEGGPSHVGKIYNCANSINLASFVGAPESCAIFQATGCTLLRSLDGLPKKITQICKLPFPLHCPTMRLLELDCPEIEVANLADSHQNFNAKMFLEILMMCREIWKTSPNKAKMRYQKEIVRHFDPVMAQW